MKKFTLTLCALAALVSAAYAGGTELSGKDSKDTKMAPPCPQWYADSEWNIGISGIYAAFTDDNDNFNDVDNGWGAAIDAKYFFHRFFGIGIQGFGLGLDSDNNNNRVVGFRNDDDTVGGVLATFTFRYPIPCSRFAPYAFFGLGGMFGDDNNDNNRFIVTGRRDNNDDGNFMGQIGAGFEVRITPRFGWTNDVSYNFVDGGNRDHVQVRSGLNFAF
jgi:opacity protein-like surface antigen